MKSYTRSFTPPHLTCLVTPHEQLNGQVFNIGRAQNIIIYLLSYNSFLYLHIWLHFEIMVKTEYFTSWTVMLAQGEGKMPPPPSRNINYYFMQFPPFIILNFCINLEQLDVRYFCPLIMCPLACQGGRGGGLYPSKYGVYPGRKQNTTIIECPLLTYLHFCIKLK